MEQIEASIERYLAALDRADRQDDEVAEAKTARLKDKIEASRRQMQHPGDAAEVEAAPDQQISLTDPDARSMATSGKGTGYRRLQRTDSRRYQAPPHRGA